MANTVEIPLAGGFLKLVMPTPNLETFRLDEWKHSLAVTTVGGFKLCGLEVVGPHGQIMAFSDILVTGLKVTGEIIPAFKGDKLVLYEMRPAPGG